VTFPHDRCALLIDVMRLHDAPREPLLQST